MEFSALTISTQRCLLDRSGKGSECTGYVFGLVYWQLGVNISLARFGSNPDSNIHRLSGAEYLLSVSSILLTRLASRALSGAYAMLSDSGAVAMFMSLIPQDSEI